MIKAIVFPTDKKFQKAMFEYKTISPNLAFPKYNDHY